MSEFIHGIPKAELHLHIEGTLEPELKFTLAERNGIDLRYEDVEAMRAAYDFDDLTSFLAMYYEGMSVLLTEHDFYDLTYAYLEKAQAQNVVYVEMFFDPQAHTSRGIDFETVLGGIRAAHVDAEDELGVRVQLIMCFLRDMSPESAMETLDQSLVHRDSIVSIGLDSDERGNPPIKFADVFARAKSEGFPIQMHCDVDQQDSVVHIRQCMDDIGVGRIDHGVNAVEDEALCEEIKRRRLGLTVCPISNSWVAGGLKEQQIRTLFDRGVMLCINSDDPAYFPGYMIENLVAIAGAAPFTDAEVATLVGNAFEMAWLPRDEKDAYLERVRSYSLSN